MAKQTPATLAADLAKRGGPKHPTMEQRAAAARRVQANPGKPILYNDKEMIARGARPASRAPTLGPVERHATATAWRPPLTGGPAYDAPSRPIVPVAGPGPQPPMGPRMNPSSPPAYQGQTTYLPLFQQAAQQGPPPMRPPQPPEYRPPMSSQAPSYQPPPANVQTMTKLIDILSQLSGGSDWGNSRPTNDPRTWLPDLWTLGR